MDEVPRTTSGRLGLIVAVGAVLLLAVVGMALAVGAKKKPVVVVEQLPGGEAKASAPAQPMAAPLETAARPLATKEVELVLRSDPPGAEVFEGVERLGVSPVTVRRARSAAPLAFTLKRSGYLEIRREVVPDRDRDVEVLLAPKTKNVADSRKHGGPTRPAASTASTPATRSGNAATPAPTKKTSDLRNPFE